MNTASFELTPEQASILLQSQDQLTVLVPGAKPYVLVPRDSYDRMKELLQVDDVDPSFFDCEEIEPPPTP